MIEYSEVKLNEDTFVPYINVTYTTKINFEFFEVLPRIKHYGSSLIDVIVEGYRQELEKTLADEMRKHGRVI